MLGAQSLSPRSLGSPQECPFPRGLLPASGTITPHVQGHAQPQTRSVPISMSGLLFCPRPSPLALRLQMLTSPTSVSGVQMVGEAVAIRRHGFVWCPHMVCPEQQSCGQGCRDPGGLWPLWLLPWAMPCTVWLLLGLLPKLFPLLCRPGPVCS